MKQDAPRTVRGEARLRAMKDTAAALFLERGYEGLRFDELIQQAGGSRRNIYDHFGGKEGLFIEVVTQLCIELDRDLVELDLSDLDERAALTLFGRQALEIVLKPRTVALQRLMIAEGHRFPDLAQAIYKTGHDKAIRLLAVWIEQRQVAGRLRSDMSAYELAGWFVDILVTGPQHRALIGLMPAPLSSSEISQLTQKAVDVFLGGTQPQETRNP